MNTREKAYPQLATWVQKQRSHYEKGKLSSAHIAKLNEVGFIWDAREMRWNSHYFELRKYHREHGNCNVPRDYKANPKLAAWVNHQRANRRKGTLCQERIERLEEVGFVWNVHKVGALREGREEGGQQQQQQHIESVAQIPPQLPGWPEQGGSTWNPSETFM